MIDIQHVYKTLGEQIVLHDLSLRVGLGEIVAVLGPSGTGKTVLLKHIIGLMHPDQGKILINGDDITQMDETKLLKVRQQFGYLFQEGALYDFMNVYDNVAFPLREHTSWDEARIQTRVKEVLAMVDLSQAELKMPSELSGGMKKRVGLARAIILEPKALLCDEPTSGLDPIRSRDISDLIRRLSVQMGAATIITSHDMYNALRIAHRIVVLKQGQVVAMGTPDAIRKSMDPFIQEFISP